ncbi:hypothetical protein BGZ63DRAFT_429244 [Mariannaea sp. PMI_226]|nr:hypothetical protein BGZ63DRAFT_429244 [Mariannaea sp. PMI_226]
MRRPKCLVPSYSNGAETRRKLHSWLGSCSSNERTLPWLSEGGSSALAIGSSTGPAFQDWLDQEAKLLWVNRPVGFGMRIICAQVVEQLSSTLETAIAHFFFSSDLESHKDPFEATDSCKRRNALHKQLLQFFPGYTFVVDSLDECTHVGNSNTPVTIFLHTIRDAVVGTKTRLLVVTRAEPEIRHGLPDDSLQRFVEYEISPDDARPPTYSRDIVDRILPKRSDDIRSILSEAMTDQYEGQFPWLKI